MATEKKFFVFLNVLLLLGIAVSLFLVYEHFSPNASKFCTFGNYFNCGIVNKSPYANIDGVFYFLVIDLGMKLPLLDISGKNFVLNLLTSDAFLGFVTLIFLFLVLNNWRSDKGFLFVTKDKAVTWMRAISLIGILFGFYLLAVQHFILRTYCIFCIALDIILAILTLAFWTKIKNK